MKLDTAIGISLLLNLVLVGVLVATLAQLGGIGGLGDFVHNQKAAEAVSQGVPVAHTEE
jgi:hypothetical protein